MRRLAVTGAIAFVVCAIAFAPVTLLRPAFDRVPGLLVSQLSGSVWRGSADVAYQGVALGRLTFSWSPREMLRARLGYTVSLSGAQARLDGTIAAAPRAYHARLAGKLDLALAAARLARYDLSIPGDLEIEGLTLDGPWRTPLPAAKGELRWGGGAVRYALGGHAHAATLPPLAGFIDSSSGYPQMTVYAVDDSTPLLLAHVTQDGMASLGITKQFTKRVGQPWVGGEPDHAVVLEVAEDLF